MSKPVPLRPDDEDVSAIRTFAVERVGAAGDSKAAIRERAKQIARCSTSGQPVDALAKALERRGMIAYRNEVKRAAPDGLTPEERQHLVDAKFRRNVKELQDYQRNVERDRERELAAAAQRERDKRDARITRAWAASAAGHEPPGPLPFGVSDPGAEALAAVWLRHLGAHDATTTRYAGDGGIDVESATCIAQVKNYTGTVGAAEVRELAGVVAVDGRRGLFFTSGRYSSGAVQFAESAGIALFTYDAVAGFLTDVNEVAASVLRDGIKPT